MFGIGKSQGVVSGMNQKMRGNGFPLKGRHLCRKVVAEWSQSPASLPVAFTTNELLKCILKLRPSLGTPEGMLTEQCEGERT